MELRASLDNGPDLKCAFFFCLFVGHLHAVSCDTTTAASFTRMRQFNYEFIHFQ